jgi:hypothetical protein
MNDCFDSQVYLSRSIVFVTARAAGSSQGYEVLSLQIDQYCRDHRGCSGGTLDFNFFVENGLAEFLKPSQWLRTTYEAPYQRYE